MEAWMAPHPSRGHLPCVSQGECETTEGLSPAKRPRPLHQRWTGLVRRYRWGSAIRGDPHLGALGMHRILRSGTTISSVHRHSGQAQREPESSTESEKPKSIWIPAFAGMTGWCTCNASAFSAVGQATVFSSRVRCDAVVGCLND